MSQYIFTPPDFLMNQDAEAIHRRILNTLPDTLDKSEPGFVWDLTRPNAMIRSEAAQFDLTLAIKNAFAQWAEGEFLEAHGDLVGIYRRPANPAYGKVVVTGTPGTDIPKGFQFATAAGNSASVIFNTVASATIDSTGACEIYIQAAEGGIHGNVAANRIVLQMKPMSSIASVTNLEPITGGTPEEEDDSFRDRILAAKRAGMSFVGNNADYDRWAREVPGVGGVVVEPEWMGPGTSTVRLIIVDPNGVPANPQIIDAVYKHIVSEGTDFARLSPVGAIVTVVAPNPVTINITADIVLKSGATLDSVRSQLLTLLLARWKISASEGLIKYSFLEADFAQINGLADFSRIFVNEARVNIPISKDQWPVTGEVVLNVVSGT